MEKQKQKKWVIALSFINDILFVIGALIVIFATYRINTNAGLYVTGAFFVLAAVALSWKPKKRKGGG